MPTLRIISPILCTLLACGPPSLSSNATDGGTDSGEAGSDTTGETSTETSTSVGFVPPTDGGLPPECDQWLQDCPDGEKCVPYSTDGGPWNAHKCVLILGDQAPGEPCTYGGITEATDDCDATGACFNVVEVDGEAIGTCLAFCTGTQDAPECPEGSSCKVGGDATLAFCFPSCDPLLQNCGGGLGCYWEGSEFSCIFTTQDIPAGEPCGFINDCAPGLSCMAAEVLPICAYSACCTPFCNLQLGDEPCAILPGTSCVPFFENDPIPGYDLVGVCNLP